MISSPILIDRSELAYYCQQAAAQKIADPTLIPLFQSAAGSLLVQAPLRPRPYVRGLYGPLALLQSIGSLGLDRYA